MVLKNAESFCRIQMFIFSKSDFIPEAETSQTPDEGSQQKSAWLPGPDSRDTVGRPMTVSLTWITHDRQQVADDVVKLLFLHQHHIKSHSNVPTKTQTQVDQSRHIFLAKEN